MFHEESRLGCFLFLGKFFILSMCTTVYGFSCKDVNAYFSFLLEETWRNRFTFCFYAFVSQFVVVHSGFLSKDFN